MSSKLDDLLARQMERSEARRANGSGEGGIPPGLQAIAKLGRDVYMAYVTQGFTEEQALKLTIAAMDRVWEALGQEVIEG